MQALKDRQARRVEPAQISVDLNKMQEHMAILLMEGITCLAPARVSSTAQGWLTREYLRSVPPDRAEDLMGEALVMATALALFTPSAGGMTAFDRLSRRPGDRTPAEAAALAALRQARFRLLRIEATETDGSAQLRDVAADEILHVDHRAVRADLAGVHLAAWLAPLPGGQFAFATEVTPLDAAGLAVAMAFVRPGRTQVVNAVRCAEAVYRHVLNHGTPRIPGLNVRPPDDEDEPDDEPDELDHLAVEWAQPGAVHAADDVQFVRTEADLDSIIAMLASAANTRAHGLAALSDAYAAIAQIQMETVHRRASAGSGSLGLATVEAAMEADIAAGDVPVGARAVFATLRRRIGAAPGAGSGRAKSDTELEKLVGRIQALRAKTVAQGCTEQEALAAAEKVAELLDRYGLSLSELDLRQQSCEGLAVETSRKRVAPIDACIPGIAAFFDCRVWSEPSANGTLRYLFFGLPADVAAARYLYDLVDQAFTRETDLFRRGETYGAVSSNMRRTASNSFQIGLGRGITAKLRALRAERETALRHSSGRDLVVTKADIVGAELAALGLNLRTRTRSTGRHVLQDAFDQGHTAGLGFAYAEGITDQG